VAGKAGEAFIEVIPELKKFGDKLSSDVDQQAQSATTRIGKSMQRVGAGMTAGLTVPIVAGFTKSFEAFSESAKVQAQTQAVLKSTGEAANVTAGHVSNLATTVSNYAGVDDEAIQSAENLLLTFTNVRNETGKGNAIFDRGTKILADMSQALGTDVTQSAIQLGKALNDPIKGVTALRRVGVDFNDQQITTIKRLVGTGRTMDAQKLILRELTKEFGGSAKAFGDSAAGGAAKAKISIENAMEDIGKAIAPAVEWFAKLFATMGAWFQNLSGPWKTAIVVILAILAALGPTLMIIGTAMTALQPIALKFGLSMTAAFGWVALIALAVAAVIALTVVIIKNWSTIKSFAIKVWNAVKNAVVAAWDWVVRASKVALRVILGIATMGMSEVVRAIIKNWSTIKKGVANAWSAVLTFLKSVPGKILAIFANAGKWLFNIGKTIVTGLIRGVQSAWSAVSTFFRSIPGKIVEFFSALPGKMFALGKEIIGQMGKGLSAAAGSLWDIAKSIVGNIASKLNPLNWFKHSPGPTPEQHYRAVWSGAFGAITDEARRAMPGVESGVGGLVRAAGLRIGVPTAGHFRGAGRGVAIAGALTLTPESGAYVRGVIEETDAAKVRHTRTLERMRGKR
jgi:tail length tape measure protein